MAFKKWNWQQDDWPNFSYKPQAIAAAQAEFGHSSGRIFGAFDLLGADDKDYLKIDLISREALHTSDIEGERLDRDSIQSSLQRRFGFHDDGHGDAGGRGEESIAAMLHELYRSYAKPLSQDELCLYHKLLMEHSSLRDIGRYRTGEEPMQIVGGPLRAEGQKVYFVAPPSERVPKEMRRFVKWFNAGEGKLPSLTRAAIAHLYFESIHPFEDGNGRIGRALAEKALAQEFGKPTLIALASTINKPTNRRKYYDALARANARNEITDWLNYFADLALESVNYTYDLVKFTIGKYQLLARLNGQINARQRKALQKLFDAEPDGFEGGLSAKKYIGFTRVSPAAATRDLRDLVEKGALTRTGERKSARYWLKLDQ